MLGEGKAVCLLLVSRRCEPASRSAARQRTLHLDATGWSSIGMGHPGLQSSDRCAGFSRAWLSLPSNGGLMVINQAERRWVNPMAPEVIMAILTARGDWGH